MRVRFIPLVSGHTSLQLTAETRSRAEESQRIITCHAFQSWANLWRYKAGIRSPPFSVIPLFTELLHFGCTFSNGHNRAHNPCPS